jgi:sugar lactone lactonase YvrE
VFDISYNSKGETMFKKSASILFVLMVVLSAVTPVYATAVTTASKVYGQGGSFITNTANKGGISASSLDFPTGGAVDKNGNLYVADRFNSRVLYYPAGSTTATRVYGQGGSFVTQNENKGGISARSLSHLYDVALDGSGNLYVSDEHNNRVLYYPAGNTTATRVYGQGGSFATNTANKGGRSAKSLYDPSGIAVDKNGNLYITDQANNRVLYYPAGSTTATRVYGQGGSFTSAADNKGGISANSLYGPGFIALDNSGNLYVADYENSRVLYYPAGKTTATRVYGQGGSFATRTANKGGISANSLNWPWGAFLDSVGNLYIEDYRNNRVLYYPAGHITATAVYGQGGSFTTNIANKGGLSANSLYGPTKVVLDGSGNMYIFDAPNNRVLVYK